MNVLFYMKQKQKRDHKNAHITNRLKQEFVDRYIKGETFTYIGNDYSVDHKTVADAFKAYSDSHKF